MVAARTGKKTQFRPSPELQRLARNRSAEFRVLMQKVRREEGDDAVAYMLQSQQAMIHTLMQELQQ